MTVLLSWKTEIGRWDCSWWPGSIRGPETTSRRSVGPGLSWEVHRDVSSRSNGDSLSLCGVAAVLHPARTNLIGVAAGRERGRLKLTDGPRRCRFRAVNPEF